MCATNAGRGCNASSSSTARSKCCLGGATACCPGDRLRIWAALRTLEEHLRRSGTHGAAVSLCQSRSFHCVWPSRFDPELEDIARRWAVATADACKTRGSRCHLGLKSVNNVALLKWQLVRHEEYQLIFLTDTDVDVLDSHYARSEQEYLMYLQRAWETGLSALLGPSAVTGQVKAPTRYPNRTQLVANPDFESPLNAGVMLFKPSAATYRRGVAALNTMRWNLTHGFELAGSPCDGVPKKAISAFASYGIRRCSWDFLGANTDQGLFWYVFAVLRHSAARSRVKSYAVKHFWAYYKPWRQTSSFWCRRWYTFLDDASAFGTEANRSDSRCVRQLSATRARVLALNASDGKNKCKGVWSKVF